MSEGAPSFDEETPRFIINKKPSGTDDQKEADQDKKEKEYKCTYCSETFKSPQGRGSHEKFVHIDAEKEKLEEIYKKADVLIAFIPRYTNMEYDPDTKNWISTPSVQLPEGFVIYKILTQVRMYRATTNVDDRSKRQFMEVMLVREGKFS